MHKAIAPMSPLRKLGWLTLVAFTIKGVTTTSLIVWALMTAVR